MSASPGDAESAENKAIDASFKAMQLKCPKCSGDMEYGMIDDYFETGANGFDQAVWSNQAMGLAPWAKRPSQKKIYCFRCVNCGYLESYAK
jgi:hypothetical protein